MPDFSRKRAILIGVDNYDYVRPLRFCGNDAQEIGQAFSQLLEFKRGDILQFTGAPKAKILHEMGVFLKGGANPEELIVFYFAGHGIRDKDTSHDYLLPADASPHDLRETAIPIEHIVGKLTGTGCTNIVMFIDACREEQESGARALSGEGMGEFSKAAVARAGVVTFFSCDPKDRSYEIEELRHGSFTHCVLEALKSGKCPTVDLMNKYLREQVPLVNTKYGKPAQLPFTIAEPLDKNELVVFFHEVKDPVRALLQKLTQLFNSENLDGKSFNNAVKFLRQVNDISQLKGDDLKKLRSVTLLSQGDLQSEAFNMSWDVLEKGQIPPSSPAKNLT